MQYTDSDLGEALGQAYVAETFPPEAKAHTLQMVHELEAALKTDISELSWMTPETKKQALEKLSRIDNKIGYPNQWRDYSSLNIVRGDAMGNSLRANQFEFNRQLAKIGKPVDRNEWGMTPPTVNAYYNPLENNVNFPAGILQPPFYDYKADDATNFGGIGVVIGHELTHGFDDEGSQFDADGNLRDWWTPKDKEQFNKLEDCFVNEYDGFVVVDDVHIKGKLTLGENTADNGGLRISHMALLDVLAANPEKTVDGFTPDQRFFLGYAQIWCENHDSGGRASAGAVERALGPAVPGQRRGVELGRFRQGLRLQAQCADGPQSRLPRLVGGTASTPRRHGEQRFLFASVHQLLQLPRHTQPCRSSWVIVKCGIGELVPPLFSPHTRGVCGASAAGGVARLQALGHHQA